MPCLLLIDWVQFNLLDFEYLQAQYKYLPSSEIKNLTKILCIQSWDCVFKQVLQAKI
jgi:hypothetical protein